MADDARWPEFENAITTIYPEMPAEAASMKNRTIRPMNWLERGLFGGAAATTYPNGTITYNKQLATDSGLRPEDLLAHELTHIKQLNGHGGLFQQLWQRMTGPKTTYENDPDEQEAFAREQLHQGNRRRDTDIKLR